MAVSYKARIGFRIKRFKQFLTEFSRVKRGVIGVGIIVFYVILAITAPLLTPYEPINPKLPGYYPTTSGSPPLAEALAVPVWYRQLPGGEQYSENLILSQDHTFSKGLDKWTWTIDNPELATVRYNTQEGEQNDGCIEVNYLRQTPTPPETPTTVTLQYNFKYPYGGPPRSFRIHVSQKAYGNITEKNYVKVELQFIRFQEYTNYTDYFHIPTNATAPGNITLTHDVSKITSVTARLPDNTIKDLIEYVDWQWIVDTRNVTLTTSLPASTEISVQYFYNQIKNYKYSYFTFEGPILIFHYPLITRTTSKPQNWTSTWFYSKSKEIDENPLYWHQPEKIIFPTAGNYTFIIKITFQDVEGTQRNMKLYLDNVNVILYGTAFGLLGTDEYPGNPRDLFTSLVYGIRLSLFIGLIASLIEVLLGVFFGLISGYFGGFVDEIIMRTVDLLMCLPGLPLILVLMVILTPSIWTIIVVLSFLGWMGMSRNIRALTLSLLCPATQ